MPERDETHGHLTAAFLGIYQVQLCKELSFSLIVTKTARDISLTYMKISSHILWDHFSKFCQFSCRALLDSQKQPDVLRRNPKIVLRGRTTGQLPHVSAEQPCSPQPAPHKMLLPKFAFASLRKKVWSSQIENGTPCYVNTPAEIRRVHILKYSF